MSWCFFPATEIARPLNVARREPVPPWQGRGLLFEAPYTQGAGNCRLHKAWSWLLRPPDVACCGQPLVSLLRGPAAPQPWASCGSRPAHSLDKRVIRMADALGSCRTPLHHGALEVSSDSLTLPCLCTATRVWAMKLHVTVGLRGIQMCTKTSSEKSLRVPKVNSLWVLGLKPDGK